MPTDEEAIDFARNRGGKLNAFDIWGEFPISFAHSADVLWWLVREGHVNN